MEISKILYNDFESIKIENDEYALVVSISVGPRILSFTKNNMDNVLCDKGNFSQIVDGEKWDIIGGHRLWHSPEAFPRTYFSDSKPVSYKIEDKGISFITQGDKSNIAKEMKIVFEQEKIRISHKLTNCGLWPVELAVWPITVLAPNGIAKIRLSDEKTGYLPNRSIVFWDYSKIDDPRIAFENNTLIVKHHSDMDSLKIGTNSNIGIGEYHLKNQVFIKEFQPIENANYPDKGCNIEVFTCDYMLEMETLSPLSTIATGESIIHDELWSIK